jgi:hypothetical protein
MAKARTWTSDAGEALPSGVSPRIALAVLSALLTVTPARAQTTGPIAVIINRHNPEDGLAVEDLRHLYLGVRTAFPNRAPVLLLALPKLSARFYASALQMSPDQVKRYWIGQLFSGDSAVPPKEIANVIELKRLVARHPGAVGFIPAADADTTVRVVDIEGKRPDDPGYPLR